MDKRLITGTLCVIILITLFSGCTVEREATTTPTIQNSPPTAVISTSGTLTSLPGYIDMTIIDAVAYAGDEITFDASASFDSDGYITSYCWIWEDSTAVQEKVTYRIFALDNIYELQGLPLIYSIVLQVEDDHEFPSLAEYRIGIIPKVHTFYFNEDGLQLQKPAAKEQLLTLSTGVLRSIQTLSYRLSEPIWIQPSSWNITLFVEKPRYSPLITVSVILLNAEGVEFDRTERQVPMLLGQKKATIHLTGNIDSKEEFLSMQLQFKGVSLKDRLSLLYGGEQASHLMFDFRI